MMKLCRLQEDCPKFDVGRKPPNHHVRMSEPCHKTLDYSCEVYVKIRYWYDEPIVCNIEKMKRLRGKK